MLRAVDEGYYYIEKRVEVRFMGDDEKAFRLPISRGKWRESFNGKNYQHKKKITRFRKREREIKNKRIKNGWL
jgi:hypothetical protein